MQKYTSKEGIYQAKATLTRAYKGYLARVAVHPDHQGRGIGVRLLAEAVAFFKREGASVITLNTQQDNQASQRLYRWFGFRPVGEEALVLRRDL